MADDPNISDGFGGTVPVSADEAGGKYVQRVKLAYSADGVATHVTADSGGLLVNLGTNNDVTVTSGTVTVGGTPTVTIGGTPAVTLASGTAVFSGSLTAGTAYVGSFGISKNGTAVADTLSLTSGTALAVGIYDNTGTQLSFATPLSVAATPSIDAGAYADQDNLDGAIISFAAAGATSGGGGYIDYLKVLDKSDQGGGGKNMLVVFLRSSITPNAQNSAFTLDDTQSAEVTAAVLTADADWTDIGGSRLAQVPVSPPIPYDITSGTTLYSVVKLVGAWTFGSTSDIVITPHFIRN